MPARLCLLLALACPAAADVAFRETPQRLILANAAIELRVDRATGQLAEIIHRPSGLQVTGAGGRTSPLDARLANRWMPSDGLPGNKAALQWRYVDHDLQPTADGKRLTVRARVGDWEVAGHYALRRTGTLVARSATFRYLGTGTPRLGDTRFNLWGVACGEPADSVYEILSRWPPKRFPMADLVPGRLAHGTSPRATSCFVRVHNRRRKLAVIAAFYSESEWGYVYLREQKASIDIMHLHKLLHRPKPNEPIHTGTQYLLVAEGDEQQTLDACQGLYDLIGVRVPPAIAERGARSIVYSCHPGGTIDSATRDVNHIRRLQQCLPRLARLGVNVVWLMPFWGGGGYAPVHYDRLDPRVADDASLRAFAHAAHARGMKVLLDLIPHGPRDSSGLHTRHREWVGTTEDGQMRYWWGCLGCDYAHPGWQRFMATHAADWVRRCDIDGFRVDCAHGSPPNWAATDGRRPSQSGLYGALGILRQARAAMEQVKKPIILLAEGEGVPLNTVSEYAYPWTWTRVLRQLRSMPIERWVPLALRWLHYQSRTMPRGANLIWFLENHDTPRAEMKWGPDTHRALLALSAFARGAAFLYQEQQVGYAPWLRRLYAIRQAHDTFTVGEADYLPLADDSRVFTILRRHHGQVAVAAINFAPEPVRTRIRLPAGIGDGAGRVFRHLQAPGPTRTALDQPIELAPFAYAALVVEQGSPSAPQPPPPVPALAPSKAEPTSRVADHSAVLRNDLVEVTVDGEQGGLIQSLRFGNHPESWVTGHESAEGPRKLWPGRQAFRLSAARGSMPTIAKQNGSVAASVATRPDSLLQVTTSTRLDRRACLVATVRLTPQADIVRTRAALTTTLRLPLADFWAVRTAEGTIADDHALWRFDDVPYRSRYWHANTSRYWESRLQPPHPDLGDRPAVFAVSKARCQWLGIRASASRPDLLQNIVLKERDGDHTQLTLRIEWLRGDRAVTLRKGEHYDLSLILSFGTGTPWRKRLRPDPPAGAPRLAVSYGEYTVTNDHYRITLRRWAGGNIRRLTLKGRGEPLSDYSTTYTDRGLYSTWGDSLGRKHPINANTDTDFEPDVAVRREGDKLIVGFESMLRHPGYGGRVVLHPRTHYRLRYTFDPSATIRVAAAVRPEMRVDKADAFLAHILRFAGVRRWAVAGADGGFHGPVGKFTGRGWQSAQHPLQAPRLAFETAGGTGVISDVSPLDGLQNFFFHPGTDTATAFFAWLDSQPVDVRPHWRTLSYTLTATPTTLDRALGGIGKLKAWPKGAER